MQLGQMINLPETHISNEFSWLWYLAQAEDESFFVIWLFSLTFSRYRRFLFKRIVLFKGSSGLKNYTLELLLKECHNFGTVRVKKKIFLWILQDLEETKYTFGESSFSYIDQRKILLFRKNDYILFLLVWWLLT